MLKQHQFDIVVVGDYIRDLLSNGGTDLFRITGPGSLQGHDAAEAIVFALNENELGNDTYARDTYAMVAFAVDEAGYSPQLA